MLASPPATPLSPFLSQKMRFWSLVAMLLLVYVHAYNLQPRYLQPWTPAPGPLSVGNWLEYFLANGVLRFRIPILFVISGYLFSFQEGRMAHRLRMQRRVRTLLVPYLLWSALGLGFTWALEQFPTTRQLVLAAAISPLGPTAPLVSAYSTGQVLLSWLLVPLPFQLWFIRSLFFYNLTYPWLRRAVDQLPWVYFPIAALVWLLGWGLGPIEGTGLLFFGLGIWLRRRGIEVQQAPAWFRPGLFLVLWLGLITGKTWLAFHSAHPSYLLMSVLHKLVEVLGMLLMWFGTDALVRAAMRQSWFIWLTKFPFFIYVLHVPLLSYATEAALHVWPGQELLVFGLLPVVVVAIILLIANAMSTLLPATYNLLTGGRGL
jgi:fucose 4-O-acetylase-like acetyltransferase